MSIIEAGPVIAKVMTENKTLKKDKTKLEKHNLELLQMIQQLKGTQQELRTIIDQLRGPPWHPAVLVELATIDNQPMALVAIGGIRRYVYVDVGLACDRLTTGDTVLLNNELNVVLRQAPWELDQEGEIAAVERWVSEGRLIIRDRDTEVMVRTAGTLRDAELSPGDQVRWDRHAGIAQERIEPTSSGAFELQEITAADVVGLGGLDVVVEKVLGRFTLSVVYPELAQDYRLSGNKSLLMVGPPGCGKTTLMRHVAGEMSRLSGSLCRVAVVNGAELESPWVGQTQSNIRGLMRQFNACSGPALLFIDEIEAIGRVRGSAVGHHSDKFLSSWLAELDGVHQRKGMAIIAATNRKDLLDQALLERVAGMEVYVGRPNMEAAREIFAIHLPDTLPYSPNGQAASNTREMLIETAVMALYGPNADNEIGVLRFRDGKSRTVLAREIASGRLFAQICEAARQAAFERHAHGGETGIGRADMAAAIAEKIDSLRSTLSPRNVRSYLADLPDDVDVIAIDRVQRKVERHRYLNS